METRAPYPLIGLFVLVVIGAVFGFVYWLHNTGGLAARTVYQVRFQNTVSGLLTGAAVLFNGIRVGEVTALALDQKDPRQVIATLAVAADTPVRADTRAGLEFQGLTGVPVVALEGGSAPPGQWPRRAGNIPLLMADPDAGQSMTAAARDALRKVDKVLAENSEPLRDTIANLKKFTEALARNSDRIDGIVAGIEKFTGAGSAATPPTYDLTAPRDVAVATKDLGGTLVVPDPTIPITFDTRKIAVLPATDLDKSFATAQWADNVPKLVQARLIQTFENAGFLKSIGRPADELTPDYRLTIDIRDFQVSAGPPPTAKVAFTVKVVGDNGKIVDARVFEAASPVKMLDAAGAAAGLDQAFGTVAAEVVKWTADVVAKAAGDSADSPPGDKPAGGRPRSPGVKPPSPAAQPASPRGG